LGRKRESFFVRLFSSEGIISSPEPRGHIQPQKKRPLTRVSPRSIQAGRRYSHMLLQRAADSAARGSMRKNRLSLTAPDGGYEEAHAMATNRAIKVICTPRRIQ
jgi:hypothetical protein